MAAGAALALVIGSSCGNSGTRGNPQAKKDSPVNDPAGIQRKKPEPYSTKDWPPPDAPPESEWERRFLDADSDEARIAILVEKESSGPEHLAGLIRRALLGSTDAVQIRAVQSARMLRGAEAVDVLSGATESASADLRILALEIARDLPDTEKRVEVFKNTLASSDAEIRKRSAIELFRMRHKPAIPILLKGYAMDDADLSDTINGQLERLTRRRFDSYEEATTWWAGHSKRFDENLTEIIPEP